MCAYVHFLSAVCALPSGSARLQSSQNRQCWFLAVSSRSGASSLTSECLLQHSPLLLSPLNSLTHFSPCSLQLLSLDTLGSALLSSSNNIIFSAVTFQSDFFSFCSSSALVRWQRFRYKCHNIHKRTSILQHSNSPLCTWRTFRCQNTLPGVYNALIGWCMPPKYLVLIWSINSLTLIIEIIVTYI